MSSMRSDEDFHGLPPLSLGCALLESGFEPDADGGWTLREAHVADVVPGGIPALRCVAVWDDIKDTPITFGVGVGKFSSVRRHDTTLEGALATLCGGVSFYYGEYSPERKGKMATFSPSVLRDWAVPKPYTDAQGKWRAPKNLAQENVVEVTLLVGDVDDGMTLPQVTRKLDELGVAYGVYATPSFTKAKPKFRIVVAIAAFKISTPEDRAVYAETYRLVMNELGITEFDRSCTDVGQYYYSANFPVPGSAPFFHGAVAESEDEIAHGRKALAAALESGDFVLFWKPGGFLNFDAVADYVRKLRAVRLEKHGTVHAPKHAAGAKPKYVFKGAYVTPNLERFTFTNGERFRITAAAEHYEGTEPSLWGGKDDAQGKAWLRCLNNGGEISGRPHTDKFECGNTTAFWLQNPRDGREFIIDCGTSGCGQFFAKPDNPEQQERLIWLDLLCQRWGVKDAAELLQFCTPVDEARKAYEAWNEKRQRNAEDPEIVRAIEDLTETSGTADIETVLKMLAECEPDVACGDALKDISKRTGRDVPTLRTSIAAHRKRAARGVIKAAPPKGEEHLAEYVGAGWDFDDQFRVAKKLAETVNARDPRLFKSGGGYVRLRPGEVEPLRTAAAWSNELHARITVRGADAIGRVRGVAISRDLLPRLTGAPDFEFPELEAYVRVQVFGPDGTLRQESGYDAATRTWTA